MRRRSRGMFCVLKSNAKYVQECLKQSRIFLPEMRLVNVSQNCKKSGLVWFGFPLSFPSCFPLPLYCVERVNRLRKKKLCLPADWWLLKCRTFIRRGMRAGAIEEICVLFICMYILVPVSGVDCTDLPCSGKVQKARRCTFTAQDTAVCAC